MKVQTYEKHFAVFYSPGTFFAETSNRPIDSWDIGKAVAMSKEITERHNAKPYGFRFETYVYPQMPPLSDGEREFKVEGQLLRRSGLHFLGGTVWTYHQVRQRDDPNDSILLSNMLSHCPIMVENRNSYLSTHAFESGDCIVDETGVVRERGTDYDDYRKKFGDR